MFQFCTANHRAGNKQPCQGKAQLESYFFEIVILNITTLFNFRHSRSGIEVTM
jgi:hypothetical protein